MIAQKIAHRGFQAAETEVIVRLAEHRARKVEGLGIASLRQPVQLRSGRIGQPDELADFIETFAGGVVHGRAEQHVLQFGLDTDEQGMAAADDEREVGFKICEGGSRRIALGPG